VRVRVALTVELGVTNSFFIFIPVEVPLPVERSEKVPPPVERGVTNSLFIFIPEPEVEDLVFSVFFFGSRVEDVLEYAILVVDWSFLFFCAIVSFLSFLCKIYEKEILP
jgi:hypothetical protein